MRKCLWLFAAGFAFLFCVLGPTNADVISTIGTQHFTVGNTYTTGAFNTAVAGQPAPFNTFCGSDTSSNCSASWTFDYTIPGGSTISGATLTLGILDIDSAAAGNQIASFTLDGTDNLTALMNTASEGLNSGAGAPNSQYDILTISIPSSDFTDLASGTATFALTLQGPGLGVLGTTTDNGAGLDFSTLDIATVATAAPEPPASMLLLAGLTGLGAMQLLAMRRRRTSDQI